ncbi:MAG: twin-arginine translocase TatA/TatE family subunit [SAR202 cluster bacterium]|nr:twin-arginine translocase TatA/TatE family subunit [SAR202 cluster bacterium]
MPKIGAWELLIILAIVLVIFGAGRLTDIGGSLGKGIRAFKDGIGGKGDDEKREHDENVLASKNEKK